jgi:uracil-DNA glycosylase family 4
MVWGSGKMTASIVFVLPFPKFIKEHDEHAIPAWNARDIIDVCKKDEKYEEGDIYMMNYLPWEPTNLQGTLDQAEYIDLFFPFFMRRLEIIKPTSVVMIGAVTQKTIQKALSSKMRYLKQINVIRTDNFNVFKVKKNAFSINFINAPHLNLKKENDESGESYSNRKVQHLKKFETSVCEAFKFQKEAANRQNSTGNIFTTMREGSTEFENKLKKKKQKSKVEKDK